MDYYCSLYIPKVGNIFLVFIGRLKSIKLRWPLEHSVTNLSSYPLLPPP